MINTQNYHTLGISAVNRYKNSLDTREERGIIELDFDVTPKMLWEEYLDVYEGIQAKIVNMTRFDENLDLSMTYLGRSDRAKCDKHRRIIPHIRAGIYIRQIIGWNRMSTTVRHRCK